MMSRALKPDDVLELSRIYEPEYNKPELHDRVLVFDVMRDGWEKTGVLISSSFKETSEANETPEEKKPEDIDSAELLETHSHEKAESAGEAKNEHPGEDNVSSENESGIESDSRNLFCRVGHSGCTETNLLEHPADENNIETPISSKPATDPNNIDILKQHKFFVHGSWLALQSSYFRSLFFSGMKESNSKEVHVKISQSELKAHLQLLEAMYKVDTLDNVGVDELLIVLELAHKYDAKFVFRKCKYVLQAAELSLQTCEKIMCFIKIEHNITDVEDLVATLQTFLAYEFNPLDETWQTASFGNLSQPSLKYLLSSDELITQSENTVFHALMHWLELNNHDISVNDPEMSLLSVVRFELMPIDYLYNVVRHHPIATKMTDFNCHYLDGVMYHALTSEMKERLAVKPAKRKAIQKDIVQYTWIIQPDQIEKLTSADEKLITSHIFWCCGYRMRMFLSNVSVQIDCVDHVIYDGSLGLQIVGMANESVLPVKWTSTIKTIGGNDLNYQHTCIFNADLSRHCIPVSFTLPNESAGSTVATTAYENGLFGFGTTTATTTKATTTNIQRIFSSTATSSSNLFSGGPRPPKDKLIPCLPKFHTTVSLSSSSNNSLLRNTLPTISTESTRKLQSFSVDLKLRLQ